jgi:hypothetical protein
LLLMVFGGCFGRLWVIWLNVHKVRSHGAYYVRYVKLYLLIRRARFWVLFSAVLYLLGYLAKLFNITGFTIK